MVSVLSTRCQSSITSARVCLSECRRLIKALRTYCCVFSKRPSNSCCSVSARSGMVRRIASIRWARNQTVLLSSLSIANHAVFRPCPGEGFGPLRGQGAFAVAGGRVDQDQLWSWPRAEAVEDSLPRHRRASECRRPKSCRCARRVLRSPHRADPSDRNPRAAECPIDAETGVSVSGADSSASVGGAGNSSGTSAMLSPTRAAAARSISPNAAAELGRRAGSVFNPSSNAEQIGSGTPLARRSGIGPAITRRTNAMGFSPRSKREWRVAAKQCENRGRQAVNVRGYRGERDPRTAPARCRTGIRPRCSRRSRGHPRCAQSRSRKVAVPRKR